LSPRKVSPLSGTPGLFKSHDLLWNIRSRIRYDHFPCSSWSQLILFRPLGCVSVHRERIFHSEARYRRDVSYDTTRKRQPRLCSRAVWLSAPPPYHGYDRRISMVDMSCQYSGRPGTRTLAKQGLKPLKRSSVCPCLQ
jgi:hypothetical protein